MTESASPTAIALLSLMKLKGLGRRSALKLVNKPLEEQDLIRCREAFLSYVSQVHQPRISTSELLDAWSKTEAQLNRNQDVGVHALAFHDQGYPVRLRKIPDPPAVLFIKGKPGGLRATRCLAVVGTREPTPYGGEIAQSSTRAAVEVGFAIVSGLAHGCDTYAHRGCVQNHGIGVAVLAHGLDKVYPAANRDLAMRLLDEGGCLVSEYPVGMAPVRSAFAERDRIQSGLSDAVLVIETDIKGGTMHTVRFARDQGRPLACIAHPQKFLMADKTKGNQKLIRDGWATPIADGDALTTFLSGISLSGYSENEVASGENLAKRQTSFGF